MNADLNIARFALATAIESSAARAEVKSRRNGETRDRETVISWIKGHQTGALRFGREAHAREIRTLHAGVAEGFAVKSQPELDDFARPAHGGTLHEGSGRNSSDAGARPTSSSDIRGDATSY